MNLIEGSSEDRKLLHRQPRREVLLAWALHLAGEVSPLQTVVWDIATAMATTTIDIRMVAAVTQPMVGIGMVFRHHRHRMKEGQHGQGPEMIVPIPDYLQDRLQENTLALTVHGATAQMDIDLGPGTWTAIVLHLGVELVARLLILTFLAIVEIIGDHPGNGMTDQEKNEPPEIEKIALASEDAMIGKIEDMIGTITVKE